MWNSSGVVGQSNPRINSQGSTSASWSAYMSCNSSNVKLPFLTTRSQYQGVDLPVHLPRGAVTVAMWNCHSWPLDVSTGGYIWALHLTSWPSWTLHLKTWPNSAVCGLLGHFIWKPYLKLPSVHIILSGGYIWQLIWTLHQTSCPSWTLHLKIWPSSDTVSGHFIWALHLQTGGLSDSLTGHFIWALHLKLRGISDSLSGYFIWQVDLVGHFIWKLDLVLTLYLDTSSEHFIWNWGVYLTPYLDTSSEHFIWTVGRGEVGEFLRAYLGTSSECWTHFGFYSSFTEVFSIKDQKAKHWSRCQ